MESLNFEDWSCTIDDKTYLWALDMRASRVLTRAMGVAFPTSAMRAARVYMPRPLD